MAKAKYSPCIKICTYDDEGYCLGCQRTADEVQGWRDRTEEEQLAGIEILRDRRIARVAELPSRHKSDAALRNSVSPVVSLRDNTFYVK